MTNQALEQIRRQHLRAQIVRGVSDRLRMRCWSQTWWRVEQQVYRQILEQVDQQLWRQLRGPA